MKRLSCKPAALLALAIVASVAGAPGYAQGPALPDGWMLTGNNVSAYHAGADQNVLRRGRATAFLTAREGDDQGFGTLMRKVDAKPYRGQRLRLRGFVKTQDLQGWTGLWMRVDQQQRVAAFDNMGNRPIKGTVDWRPYDVVLDVPRDADEIAYGMLMIGAGTSWVSEVGLTPVGKDVPTTGDSGSQPRNLGFEE